MYIRLYLYGMEEKIKRKIRTYKATDKDYFSAMKYAKLIGEPLTRIIEKRIKIMAGMAETPLVKRVLKSKS